MEWTDNFFGSEYYLKTHLPFLTEEKSQKEIEFLETVLELKTGDKILDVPCGHGRHSILLSKKGYDVTGVDIQPDFIKIAKENSKDIPNAFFFIEDMRNLDFHEEFDCVLNLFSSFGYFSDEENMYVLSLMIKSLKKGGKLLIESINREFCVNNTGKVDQAWIVYPPDNVTFLANNKFDLINGRMISDQLIIDNGVRHEQQQNIRLYTFTEIKLLFNMNGMAVVDCFGDFDKSKYSYNSNKMIIIGQKV